MLIFRNDARRPADLPYTHGDSFVLHSAFLMSEWHGGQVTHNWPNIFTHLVAACVADVLGAATYFQLIPHLSTVALLDDLMFELDHSHLSATIWICAFSVNQHSWICKNIHEDWSHTPVRAATSIIITLPGSKVGLEHLDMDRKFGNS